MRLSPVLAALALFTGESTSGADPGVGQGRNSRTLHLPKQYAQHSKLPELALVEPASGEAAATHLPSSSPGPFAVPCLQLAMLASPRVPFLFSGASERSKTFEESCAPRAHRAFAGAHGRLREKHRNKQTPLHTPKENGGYLFQAHNSPAPHNKDKALHRFRSARSAWAAAVTHRSAASARALRRPRPRHSKMKCIQLRPAPSRTCSTRDESPWQAGRAFAVSCVASAASISKPVNLCHATCVLWRTYSND